MEFLCFNHIFLSLIDQHLQDYDLSGNSHLLTLDFGNIVTKRISPPLALINTPFHHTFDAFTRLTNNKLFIGSDTIIAELFAILPASGPPIPPVTSVQHIFDIDINNSIVYRDFGIMVRHTTTLLLANHGRS